VLLSVILPLCQSPVAQWLSHKPAIFPCKAAIRIMLASFISQPRRNLGDRRHLTVGGIAVQLVAQPDVDAPIP